MKKNNYLRVVPKCLDDKLNTELRIFSIKTFDGREFGSAFDYCSKCKKYLWKGEMEVDEKKIALSFANSFGHSYQLEDIFELDISKFY